MSLIDWSDPEEMIGLLIEYVSDEALTADDDVERADFLNALSRDLEELTVHDVAEVNRLAEAIQEIRAAQPAAFLGDPVITHLDACIEELHRIGSDIRQATV